MKDLTGQKFKRWTVVSFDGHRKGFDYWNCVCSCAEAPQRSVNAKNLFNGRSGSCGCLRAKRLADWSRTHGMSSTRIFNVWGSMLERCLNPKSKSFKDYGGRGITVSDAWRSFEAFYNDIGVKYKPGLLLERVNNDGDYCKENCVWADRFVQAANRRNNVRVMTSEGEMILAEATRRSGVSSETMRERVIAKWPPERLLNPPRRMRVIETPWGRLSVKDAAERAGMSYHTLRARLLRRWPPEKWFRSKRRTAA